MKAVIATVAPVVMVTLFRFKSEPDVPTEPSATRKPVDLTIENQAAVPPTALGSLVMGLAVMTPAAAAPKALVVGAVRLAITTLPAVMAADVSAGWTPE